MKHLFLFLAGVMAAGVALWLVGRALYAKCPPPGICDDLTAQSDHSFPCGPSYCRHGIGFNPQDIPN